MTSNSPKDPSKPTTEKTTAAEKSTAAKILNNVKTAAKELHIALPGGIAYSAKGLKFGSTIEQDSDKTRPAARVVCNVLGEIAKMSIIGKPAVKAAKKGAQMMPQKSPLMRIIGACNGAYGAANTLEPVANFAKEEVTKYCKVLFELVETKTTQDFNHQNFNDALANVDDMELSHEQAAELSLSIINGVFAGLENIVDTVMHPYDNFLEPVGMLLWDTSVLCSQNASSKTYLESYIRMNERWHGLCQKTEEFIAADFCQQVEIFTELVTGAYIGGRTLATAAKTTEKFANALRFGETFRVKSFKANHAFTNTSLNFSPEFLSFTIDTSGELSLAGGMALRLGNGRTVHLSQFNSSKRVLAAGELELGHKASQGTNHSGEFKKQ